MAWSTGSCSAGTPGVIRGGPTVRVALVVAKEVELAVCDPHGADEANTEIALLLRFDVVEESESSVRTRPSERIQQEVK
jgi:hypothetical protein